MQNMADHFLCHYFIVVRCIIFFEILLIFLGETVGYRKKKNYDVKDDLDNESSQLWNMNTIIPTKYVYLHIDVASVSTLLVLKKKLPWGQSLLIIFVYDVMLILRCWYFISVGVSIILTKLNNCHVNDHLFKM